MTFKIRNTTYGERDEVIAVTLAAFAGNDAVAIVRYVWNHEQAADDLDLVAVDGDEVIGHVLGSHATVDDRAVVAVAPLSVRPDRQRSGGGSALMHELIRRVDAAGHVPLGLRGSPDYYPRFGFEAGFSLGMYAGEPTEAPAFQVRRLSTYDPSYRGPFLYGWDRDPDGLGS